MRAAHLMLILLLAAALVGCRSSTTTTANGRSAPGTSGTAGQDAPAANVDVQLGQWFVKLNPDTVPSGSVHFSVRNVGTITHALVVSGQGIEQRTQNLQPGETTEMTVSLRPGQYTAYCPIDNHRELGMRSTLTVQ